jgi:hypothetical protein
MKIAMHVMIIVAGAGIGLAVGLMLRKKPATLSNAAIVRTATVEQATLFKSNSSFTTKAERNARLEDSSLATQLERDLSMSSGVTRWLYWLEALEKATAADCPRLARLAQGNSSLVRLLGARWAELDPRHMFESILASQGPGFPAGELQRVLFEEWPKRDLEGLIAALNRTNGLAVPEQWRRNFAVNLIDKNVERGLALMHEWNVENYGPRMTAVKKWAAANPRHAAEFALAHPSGHATRMVMETIGKEWARTDPAGALEFAMGNRSASRSPLAHSVLKTWADRNLAEATDWLAKANNETRDYLSPAFVEGWAKYDAATALKWSEANLKGTTFANAAAGVVKGAVEVDLAGAAALVTSMGPSKARGDAAAVVMQKWMPEYSSNKPVEPEAIAWLKRLDGDAISHVLQETQWRWAESDPKGMATFIGSLKPEQVPSQTYSTLARHLARENPVETMAWAQQLPENRRISIAVDAFSEWQRSQPEAAREWLQGLPEKDPRREPLFANVVQQFAHAPHGAEQLATLKPAEQAAARAIIEKMSLPEDRRRALLGALEPRR